MCFLGDAARIALAAVLFVACGGGGAGDAGTPGDDGGATGDGGAGSARQLGGLPSGRWIEALAFSPDGSHLLAATENQVGGTDGEARVWDVASGQTSWTVPGPCWSVDVTADDETAVVGGASVTVVQAMSGEVARMLMNGAGAAAFSHEGKWIAYADPTVNGVSIVDAKTNAPVGQVMHPVVMNERIWRVAFSPDDSMLLTASGQNGLGSPHGQTTVWRTSDWSSAYQVSCTTFDAAFSPDGKSIALACWTGARIVSSADGQMARALNTANVLQAIGVAWSPDGSEVAVGAFEGGVSVFRASDASLVATLTDGAAGPTVKGIAWSPDGKTIAGGGWDDALVRLWPSP